MAFVKLDTTMLRSSLWVERDQRSLFVTALLMAEPFELTEPTPQIEARSLAPTGWMVPAGWYGLVRAAGVGIVRLDGLDREEGMAALEILGAPDPESRSQDFEGRRLVRVDGGFLVLNYMKYRDYDHTAANRQKRFRDRKKKGSVTGDGSDVTRDVALQSHMAEAEGRRQRAEGKGTETSSSSAGCDVSQTSPDFDSVAVLLASLPEKQRPAWAAEIRVAKDGMHGPALTDEQIQAACRDYLGNVSTEPSLRHFRAYLVNGARIVKRHDPSTPDAFSAGLAQWAKDNP